MHCGGSQNSQVKTASITSTAVCMCVTYSDFLHLTLCTCTHKLLEGVAMSAGLSVESHYARNSLLTLEQLLWHAFMGISSICVMDNIPVQAT